MTLNTANAQNMTTLLACPSSPNCVSSQANLSDKEHYIAPFKIIGSIETALPALEQALLKLSRTKIINKTAQSLQAEVTSLIFRFVDDVDVLIDGDAKLIHIRSASRTGHSDFGVNRNRVEEIRAALQRAQVIE